MFVTAKYHKAAIHEKDDIIDGLMKRLTAMEAKLAPLERRVRGERGRYVAHDPIRAQFESECG